jgi:enediyne core biosynthesis thioesterase
MTVKHFEHRLAVSFSDTNVVGNVYFANYLLWQGKCREEFLRRYAPRVLQDFRSGCGMITQECSCVFHHETFAFEEIVIRMRLERLTWTAVTMGFEYFRVEPSGLRTLVAEGRQSAAWVNALHQPAMFPRYLYEAIDRFAQQDESSPAVGEAAP